MTQPIKNGNLVRIHTIVHELEYLAHVGLDEEEMELLENYKKGFDEKTKNNNLFRPLVKVSQVLDKIMEF